MNSLMTTLTLAALSLAGPGQTRTIQIYVPGQPKRVETGSAGTYVPYRHCSNWEWNWGWGNWGWSRWGTTWAETWARGQAELIRSQGEYQRNLATAWNQAEKARSRRIENNLKATQVYFEKQRINKSHERAERRGTAPDEGTSLTSKASATARLALDQFDAETGAIRWPVVLRTDPFAQEREELDRLFAERNRSNRPLDAAQASQAQAAAKEMLAKLKEQIKEINTADYVAAKKFIQSVAREARLAPAGHDVPGGLASR